MSFWPRLFGSKRKDRHNCGSIPAPRLPTPDPSDVSWDSPRKIDDPSWFTYGKARSRANFRNHDYHRELVDWEVEAYRRENPDQEEAIQLYKEAIEYQVARAGFFAGGVTLRNDAETHKAAMHGKNAITAYIDLALVYRVHKDFDLARSCANAALDIYDRYPMHVQEEPKMLTLRSEANLVLTEIEHYLGTVPAQKLEKKYLQILEISGNGIQERKTQAYHWPTLVRLITVSLFLFGATALQSAEYTSVIADGNDYRIARVAADSQGNTYLAGTRLLDSSSEIFVTKLDASGNIVLFRTLSGQGNDVCTDMAIDTAGYIYLGGSTSSPDFPLHNALQATVGPGFLVKFSPDASDLVWSTYFREAVVALAVDSGGSVYVTGSTNDPNFPVTAGLPHSTVTQTYGLSSIAGAFLTKISAAGDRIIYSAVISGTAKDCGAGSSCFTSDRHTAGVSLAVDTSGSAYWAGNTDTSNLPTTGGALLTKGTGAFVAKVNAAGTALVYLTYVGATHCPLSINTNPANTASAIAADAAGNAYLIGETFDPAFPATAGAYQTQYSGPAVCSLLPLPPTDNFVLKLNPTGSSAVWATYVGGTGAETANSVAVDSAGQVWFVGTTASSDFPNTQGWSQGSDFVTGLNASGSKLVYTARYPNDGTSRAVAVDASGLLHVAGPTGTVSTIMPSAPPTPRVFGVANAANGPLDPRVAAGEVISIYGPHIGPSTPVLTQPDSSGNFPTALPGYQLITSLQVPQPLPLLYASDSQINAVIPFLSYATGPLRIITPNGTLPDFRLITVAAAPQIFHNPDNSPVAVNEDGTFNGPANPARLGSTVSIWVTGSGVNMIANAGGIASTAQNLYCCGVQIGMPFGGQAEATVLYAGTAPGSVFGISQVNFQVPNSIVFFGNEASIPLVVTADNRASIPVTLYVAQ